MEWEWYWLAEALGLSEDISVPGSGEISYSVSARANEIFALLSLNAAVCAVIGLFLAGFFIRRHACKAGDPDGGRLCLTVGGVILLMIGLFQAVGVGPYIEWYPGQHSVGFIDLSVIGHIITGIFYAILALILHLGGRLGRRCALRHFNRSKSIKQEETP